MSVLLILAALAAGQTPPERTLVDRIVAVVNEDVVTLSELEGASGPLLTPSMDEKRKKKVYEEALDQLIADRLLTQQVAEAKLDVSSDEVERAIDDICRQNNITREQLQEAVESRNMSMSQYQQDLERQLVRLKLVDLKVRSRIVVPESDIRQEYEAQIALEDREELVQIRHLFFRWGDSPSADEKKRVLGRALAARARVEAGEDFSKLAAEVSEGPTASSGGDLGELGAESLLPELAKALQTMKDGELSPPIETPNGVHVVLLVARRTKGPESYESQKTKIYQQLYQKEVDRQMRIWIEELRSQSAVEVRL